MEIRSFGQVFLYLGTEEKEIWLPYFKPLINSLLHIAAYISGNGFVLEIHATDTEEAKEIIRQIKEEKITDPIRPTRIVDLDRLEVVCGDQTFEVNSRHILIDKFFDLAEYLSTDLLLIQLPNTSEGRRLFDQFEPI